MATYTQQNRLIAIDTPLGEDVLLLRGFHGSEAISRLFQFELDLLSENRSISFDNLVGKSVTLRVTLADGSNRYWNGVVSRFSQGSYEKGFTQYHAVMVPWLWFLSRTADCRIFQNKKAPDIIQQIFKDLNFSDYKLQLYGSFVEREYCVQYRETDFNFVSRLMEEEGIFYFFEHENGKHTLVLANDPAAQKPCPNQPSVRYALTPGTWQEEDIILEWRQEQEVRPGKYSVTDYNFETPSSNLAASVKGKDTYEIYDYPGEYRKRADGDSLARIRLQEQEMPRVVARGSSDCRAFTTGYLFDLKGHYRNDVNQSYLLTAISHVATQGGDYTSASTAGSGDFSYSNSFECIPASTPFRPPRLTPAPFVQGCQTAVVVGPGGEEIFTDKYGRVKVQFYWDRVGKRNENSSCWMRVSYPWAGKGWGAIAIPRIGQEVIVDFLEGDPDQPIITGRVYNAGEMPPYGLPGEGVISGVKSNSTKGGGGYNEFIFDDTKGSELIRVHGQKDRQEKIEHNESVTIGNDRTESVGHDESITIGNNRTEKVGVNENITIGSNRTESVGANETISIGSNRTETVGANESITVALTRTRNVGINEMVNVGAAQEITIGGLQALTVGLTRAKTIGVSESVNIGTSQTVGIGTSQSINVGTDHSQTVGNNKTIKVGSNLDETIGADEKVSIGSNLTESIATDHKNSVGGKRETKIGSDDKLDVGSNLTITAGSQITLETGQSKIVMKSGGQIEISGMSIDIKGSTSIKAEAVTINVEASGVNTIKGSLVKIN